MLGGLQIPPLYLHYYKSEMSLTKVFTTNKVPILIKDFFQRKRGWPCSLYKLHVY